MKTKQNKKTKDSTPSDSPACSRRSFLKKLWLPLGILALGELVWITFSFLRPRSPGIGKSEWDQA